MRENRDLFSVVICREDRAAEYFTFTSRPCALPRGRVDKERRYLDSVECNWFLRALSSRQLSFGSACGAHLKLG